MDNNNQEVNPEQNASGSNSPQPPVPPQATPQVSSQGTPQYGNVPPQGTPQYGNVPPQGAPQYGNVPPQGAPQYGNVPPQAQYSQPMKKETDILAILALVTAFIVPIAAIVMGHISLSRIKSGRYDGQGLAKAGLILGYVFTAFLILYIILIFIIGFVLAMQDPELLYY